LSSFENRLTQSECSRKSTIPNGRFPTFDYGSRVKSIFNDFIEIYDAMMGERKGEKGENSERITESPKSIQNRLKETLEDLRKLDRISATESTTVPFDWEENLKLNISELITYYDNMVKGVNPHSGSSLDSQVYTSEELDKLVQYMEEQYDKMLEDEKKAEQEITSTEGSTAPESTTDINNNIAYESVLSPDFNVTALIEQFKIWSEENKMKQKLMDKEFKGNNEETTTENTSTEDTSTDVSPDYSENIEKYLFNIL